MTDRDFDAEVTRQFAILRGEETPWRLLDSARELHEVLGRRVRPT